MSAVGVQLNICYLSYLLGASEMLLHLLHGVNLRELLRQILVLVVLLVLPRTRIEGGSSSWSAVLVATA